MNEPVRRRWQHIKDELGLEPEARPEPTPAPSRPAPPPPREEREEELAPVEIPEEDFPEGPTEATGAPDEEGGEKKGGRKRRRRRRRKGGGDRPEAEGVERVGSADTPEEVEERAQEPIADYREEGADGPEILEAPGEDELEAEEPPAEAEEVTPERPEEVESEPIEDMSNWNIPSWQEIVASLYRPDR